MDIDVVIVIPLNLLIMVDIDDVIVALVNSLIAVDIDDVTVVLVNSLIMVDIDDVIVALVVNWPDNYNYQVNCELSGKHYLTYWWILQDILM